MHRGAVGLAPIDVVERGPASAREIAMRAGSHLVVARFLRAHGLRGEAVVASLTDDPQGVFVPGRRLAAVSAEGQPSGPEWTLSRARAFGAGWLLAFGEVTSRTALEALRLGFLGVRREELRALPEGAMYLHEIEGAEVVVEGRVIGRARDVVGVSGAEVLVVEGEDREYLIPFRPPILKRLDRVQRRIEVDPPAGLLDL